MLVICFLVLKAAVLYREHLSLADYDSYTNDLYSTGRPDKIKLNFPLCLTQNVWRYFPSVELGYISGRWLGQIDFMRHETLIVTVENQLAQRSCFLDVYGFLQAVWGMLNILQLRKADKDCGCQISNSNFTISWLSHQQIRKLLLTRQALLFLCFSGCGNSPY